MPGAAASPTEANRSTMADYVFARVSWALGISFRCQLVWQFDSALPAEAAKQMHAGLSAGPLSRVMVRPRVLGARATWKRSAVPGGLAINTDPLPQADRQAWSREQLRTVPLDIEHGPTWHINTTQTADGGTLLSLVWLHAVADGSAVVNAAVAALTGRDLGCLPDDAAGLPSLWDDVKDAVGRFWTVLTGIAQLLILLPRGLQQRTATAKPKAARPSDLGAGGGRTQVSTILRFSRDAWSHAAATRGGTDNTLALALAGRLALATGCVANTDIVPVDLSVSERNLSSRDTRSNVLTSAIVPTRTTDAAIADLSETRQAAKRSLSQTQDKSRKALYSAQQIVYFLPTWVLRRAASNPPAPCLLSNISAMPPEILRVGGLTASFIAPQAEWCDLPEYIRRTPSPDIEVFCTGTREAVIIVVQRNNSTNGLSTQDLNEIVIAESARFGLSPEPVW